MPVPESNLFLITAVVAITTMAVTLWMAFYLFARGFPNRVTMRAVVVLLLISLFFLAIYNNIFHQTVGSASWRAVLLITGMAFWYSVTYNLMSYQSRQRFRVLAYGMYAFAILTAILMLTPGSFINEEGNSYYASQMAGDVPNIVYEIYQFIFLILTSYNLFVDRGPRLPMEGRYFLIASILPAGKILSGVFIWITRDPLPRFIPDLFLFAGVVILGLSVLYHQSLVERRTTIQDFPIAGLTALGVAALYAVLAFRWGVPVDALASVVAVVILTHSLYDIVREFLERQRIRSEGAFRRQLRQLEHQPTSDEALQSRLQDGLDLLCNTLDSSSGVIAVQRAENFVVIATRSSIPIETQIPAGVLLSEDVSERKTDQLAGISWIAPAFEEQRQVAAIGIGNPNAKLDYSTGDLDLLADVADHIGKMVALANSSRDLRSVHETKPENIDLSSAADEMIASISTNPDAEFVKLVEDALRHFSDYIALGQSPLADQLGIRAESHVERGKQLQKFLADAIDSFRPAGTRPQEPLPRVWYSYSVLYDAYVEGVPNREITARLYISEGTFNRTRRNALRGLARLIMERSKKAVGTS